MQGTFYVRVVRKRSCSLCSFFMLKINNTLESQNLGAVSQKRG